MRKKIVIGITGCFGTGKSSVAKMFSELGAHVLNADRIAHEVIMPGEDAYRKVVFLFGRIILKKDRTIDRKKLGKIIFGNNRMRRHLQNVVHPAVIKKIKHSIKKSTEHIAMIDAPLLVEAGMLRTVDKIIVVYAKKNIQLKRCQAKWHLSKEEVLQRIRSQMSLSTKLHLADFIIDNNGTMRSTKSKVRKIWEEIKQW